MPSDYDKIKKENMIKYGTDTWYEDILTYMYSDKTHFIFELIQNAEDAEASEIEFKLFPTQIDIIHTGKRLFNLQDVKGICGLAKGTKKEDLTKIGKFGLGFKSVYAYTDRPLVYSGDESFQIEHFVRPKAVMPLKDLKKSLTKFILPFKEGINKSVAFDEISKKLKELPLRTLLFLNNISNIKWNIQGEEGEYVREPYNHKFFEICKIKKIEGKEEIEEKYWVKEKLPIPGSYPNLYVEIAFRIQPPKKDGEIIIIPEEDTQLVVFFPTEKETHLNFLVQGPYRTTHTRENIPPDDDWNKILIKTTVELIKKSLLKFKERKILNVDSLQIFPIDKTNFPSDSMFFPFYTAIKDVILSGEEVLPTGKGQYTSHQCALIARTKELRDLLGLEQLSELFDKNDVSWLDSSITIDRTPTLKKYLAEEIDIEEITPEKFASYYSESFIRSQTDKWVISFYKFLSKQESLLKKRTRWSKEGLLRFKPIIRLSDDTHICPFDKDEKPQVFIASGQKYDSLFKIVKLNISKDTSAKEFLQALGIRKPDKIAGIRQQIIPKYKKEILDISEKENLQDVEHIKKTIESDNSPEIQELIKELQSTPFLIGKNPNSGEVFFSDPSYLYLSKEFSNIEDLEIYFENNPDVLFLDTKYRDLLPIKILRKLGCNELIKITYKRPSYVSHIELVDYHGLHERGLYGFDPDFEIDGLKFALDNINIKRAKIIWDFVKEYSSTIKGTVETSSRQDYAHSRKKTCMSNAGMLLINNKWLPDKKGIYHKPSKILLSELHESLEKESDGARLISEKIMKKPIAEEILENLSQDEKEKLDVLKALADYSKEELEELHDHLQKKNKIKNKTEKPSDERYAQTLAKQTSPTEASVIDEEDLTYPPITKEGLTEEERRNLNELEIEEAIEKLEKDREETLKSQLNASSQLPSELKEKLIQDYDGRCQICFERILNNKRQPHLRIRRIVTPHQSSKGIADEGNCLALCPNCWIRLSKNFPWSFAKNGKATYEPEFDNCDRIEKNDREFITLKIIMDGKERSIQYIESHFNRFKHLYENY